MEEFVKLKGKTQTSHKESNKNAVLWVKLCGQFPQSALKMRKVRDP